MIQVTDRIFVGNSHDEKHAQLKEDSAVLNVAFDKAATRGWGTGIEYAQVGLVDGPGNELGNYVAAVLSLSFLLKRRKDVLVCCHKGQSRSVAVVMMYLHLVNGQDWATLLERIKKLGTKLQVPNPHEAHRFAFESIDWDIVRRYL